MTVIPVARHIVAAILIGAGSLTALPSIAQPGGGAVMPVLVTPLEKRATALLERAAKHIEAQGEAGTVAFSREAAFVDRDLYVYALRMDGQFLASGGFSAGLVGSNVIKYTDTDGKAFFREMVDKAREAGQGRVEYRWYNPADSRGEPKTTLFRRVGEVIVAVGYFSPRATAVDAKSMLKAAEKALQTDAQVALADFQRIDGRYRRDDLYVFAIDLQSRRFLAHGANPELVGTDAATLRDAGGRAIVQEMLDVVRSKPGGELEYRWGNPITGRIELKHSYFHKVGGTVLGVGFYRR